MPERKLIVTLPARKDLRKIRAYTLARYGRAAADGYERLIKQSFKDLIAEPLRPGSRERQDIHKHIRSYHIALSRVRASAKIKAPRHFVLYFLPDADHLVISRLLHDGSDLSNHIPETHKQAIRRNRVPKE